MKETKRSETKKEHITLWRIWFPKYGNRYLFRILFMLYLAYWYIYTMFYFLYTGIKANVIQGGVFLNWFEEFAIIFVPFVVIALSSHFIFKKKLKWWVEIVSTILIIIVVQTITKFIVFHWLIK